jgi:redox-sensitive bicupin YhaK (pirin superfamily)
MSLLEAGVPECTGSAGTIQWVIKPQLKDLGEMTVRRVLPSKELRMVGPFIFFDHMGPAVFPPGKGIQVRPHPHIGIATITYLFEGEIMHRDSLGYVQPIRQGAINLMTAGRGIVHSERAGSDFDTTARLHGIQSWMALPAEQEGCAPAFVHVPASEIPAIEVGGVQVRVIIGKAYGSTSPVAVHVPMLYLELHMPRDTSLDLPEHYHELAAYVIDGEVAIDSCSYSSGTLAVACPDKPVRLSASQPSHVMIIGGDPVGHRHIWWNFVASSRERIEQAKADWRAQRFGSVPGDQEFIPLPE